MKFTAVAVSALAAGAIGIVAAPIASADPDLTTFGSQATLIDGTVVQGWTVSGLKPSADVIPYPVQGTLWEATATDEAIAGGATPIVSNFNARARSGQTYRVLFGVATPQGVNPSTLAQGQQTTGKVYFDVIGDTPDSVVYNAGGQDLIVWVQPPPAPAPAGSGSRSGSYSTGTGTAAPAEMTPAPAAADTTATPAPPAGSSGTPLPAGSSGTPVAEGTPAVTPAPAAGSTGTPITEGTTATATPVPAEAGQTAMTPAAATAGSQGTPATQPAAPSTTVIPAPAG